MPDHRTQQTDDPIEILHVEDNPGDIRLTEEAFKATSREIVFRSVMDGAKAVDRLREQAAQESRALPDIVLLDLNLPGRHGCGVLDAIRDHSQLGAIPVIILTSSSAPEDVERCYGGKANAYLTKPTDPGDFESLAEKVERFWFERAVLPPVPA